jgi:hypothetical protein
MFESRGSAAFATMGDLRTRTKQTIARVQERPLYLLKEGEPIGVIVSIAMLELLQDVLQERYVSDVVQEGLGALRAGSDELQEEAASGRRPTRSWLQGREPMAARGRNRPGKGRRAGRHSPAVAAPTGR